MSVAVFSAYFDTSGNKGKTVLTSVGFVSRIKKWDRFNDEWNGILKQDGITTMHMTDFVSSQGEFSSWKGQSERRRPFVTALSRCIRKNTNKGFGSSVINADYKAVNSAFMFREHAGEPFSLCMRACLGGLRKWAAKKAIKIEDLLVFIEQGDDGQSQLIQAAHDDGFKVVPLFKKDSAAWLETWPHGSFERRSIMPPMSLL